MRHGIERRWLLSALVFLILLCLFLIAGRLGSPATAEANLQTGNKGDILVIPVQLERDSYGIAMVDTVAQTMWIYRLNSRGPNQKRLELLAARCWKYDRLLQQYNTAEPKPQQVKEILEEFGKMEEQKQQDSIINILEIIGPNSTHLDD